MRNLGTKFKRGVAKCYVNLTGLIQPVSKSNAENFNQEQKEVEELMRMNKGMRRRTDGRYDWRQTINKQPHYLINPCPRTLAKEVKAYKANLEKADAKPVKTKESRRFIDLAWTWFNLNKKGKIKSEREYRARLENYICKLNKDINTYTKNDILEFLNKIESHKAREYCFPILKNVFAEAMEAGIIKRNVIATLKLPEGRQREKGLWYNVEEQKLIRDNLHTCRVRHEVEFILMVGCRIEECFNCRLEIDKLRVYVERSKVDSTPGFVTISPVYAKHLEEHWETMFRMSYDFYAREFVKLIQELRIKRQKNDKPLHRLRHTFGTNLYYLGVDDKRRSYLMGHTSTKMTNNVYTDFDPDV